jgi:hypothetical protein
MRILCVLFGLISAASLVTPANATPMTYGCDTAADRFSAIEQTVDLRNFTLATKIQPNEFRKGKYSPLAQVYFESLDEKNRWALKVIAADHKAKTALVLIEMTIEGKTDEPFLIGSVDIGKQLPLSISITEGSKIQFKIGELDGSPELKLGDQAKLNIVCSSGDFVFSDLDWGRK